MHLTTSLVLAVLGASTTLAFPFNEADSNAGLFRREAGSDGSTRMYRRGWGWRGKKQHRDDQQFDYQQRDLSDEPVLARRRKHGRGRPERPWRHQFGDGGPPGGRMSQVTDGGDGTTDTQRRSLGEEVTPPAASAVSTATGAPHVPESKEATTVSSHDSIPSTTDSAHSAEVGEGEHKKKSRHRKSGKHRGGKKHPSKHGDEETSSDDAPAEHKHGHRHRKHKAHKHRHNKSGRKHKHHEEDGTSDDESVGHHRKSRKHRHRKQRLQIHEGPEGVEHAEKVEHAVHEHVEHENEHAEPEHEAKHKSKHSGKHSSRKHKKVHPDDAKVDAAAAPASSFEPLSQVVQQRGLQIDELD